MNWIKQNKFLTGFLAVMVVGVGALGFLLFSAMSHYEEVQTDYQTKVSELNRLESLKPYPEINNLKQFDAQKKELAAAIDALHKNLAAVQIPVEPLSSVQFQDKLRAAVTRVTTKGTESGVKFPTPFYLGFDKYQTEPPPEVAAPVLGRQLKALELVAMKMIEAGVLTVEKFDRDTLPEEEGKGKKAGSEGPGKPGGAGARSEKAPKELVAHHSLKLEFTAEQSRFRSVLNEIVAAKEQFFIPRLVSVKNEKDIAPTRGIAAAVAVAAPPEGEEKKFSYVFGSEKVAVALLLEMVNFAEVAAK